MRSDFSLLFHLTNYSYTVKNYMEVNIANIESMGGCVYLPFEPNTSDIPELNGDVIVESTLFDGYGVFAHNGKYYKISYSKLEEIRDDEQVRITINQHRFGYRLPDNFDIAVDDLALTLGEIEECEHSEYVGYLIDGLIGNIEHLVIEDGIREVLSPDQCATKLREIEKCPPKYLYYFTDHNDFGEQFDDKLFCVCDMAGEPICDVLESDLAELEQQGIVDDDATLTSEEHRAKLLATRFEAIVFLKNKQMNNSTQTYWQRIDALRKEITAEIIQTIIDHNLTEVEIYDEEGDNVSVMWFDRHDNINDTAVKVVRVKDGELVLLVESSDCDDEDEEIQNYDFAQRHIGWLAEILDHVNAALTSKDENDGK